MIRELEQIQLLLENINGNLVGKTSEKHDFQKKTPGLKHSKKEIEQEKILLKYVTNHLIPEIKISVSIIFRLSFIGKVPRYELINYYYNNSDATVANPSSSTVC